MRFKVPEGKTSYTDHVRGHIEFDHAQIEDFVILRSNGLPIYHLSVVADDIDMGITHVIRGDDHISNTPKHILLWQALGRTPPEFAHVPLILGTDKKKLSKRHGMTSVTEYERIGYLPDAMVNFLGLLGWSPGGNRELMSRDEMVAAFALEGISGGACGVRSRKARLVQRAVSVSALAGRSGSVCEAAAAGGRLVGRGLRPCRQTRVASAGAPPRSAAREAAPDFVDQARPFLTATIEYDSEAVRKHLGTADLDTHIEALIVALEEDDGPFDEAAIERILRSVADARGVKAAALIHAARIAATGKAVSPGIFEVLALLGKAPTLSRLRDLVGFLRISSPKLGAK